jgi:hypothetical protein
MNACVYECAEIAVNAQSLKHKLGRNTKILNSFSLLRNHFQASTPP